MGLPDIEKKWEEYKKARIKVFPNNNLRASSIGHPCKKYHYYSIVNWEDREPITPTLQSIFDEGDYHERRVTIDLMEMGFQVVEQQRSYQIDDPLITGSIDGMIAWEGKRYPYDVKTINPYDFEKINSSDDLIYSKKIHQRKYPAQLQIYLLQSGEEVGCFILKNKLTGWIKVIWMAINYAYCDELIDMASEVYRAIELRELPGNHDDLDVCMKCDFKHICLPDLKSKNQIVKWDDEEMEAKIIKREELQPVAKEFKELDEEIKGEAKKELGDRICGDYLIRVKEVIQKQGQPDERRSRRTQIVKI